MRSFIKPDNLNQYLKETRGRFLPVMMSNIKSDPYWQDPADPHRRVAVETGLIKPTIPWWMNYNPAYSAVLSEQIWSQAEANITQKNMTPEQAMPRKRSAESRRSSSASRSSDGEAQRRGASVFRLARRCMLAPRPPVTTRTPPPLSA